MPSARDRCGRPAGRGAPMAERLALVVTTSAASSARTNGATLRADEVVHLLEHSGHRVARTTGADLGSAPARVDLAVAVSYACAGHVTELRRRAPRVWLDAVDSWSLVNGSGLRHGHVSYAARAVRDGWRLANMARPDLVTWISGADLARDRRTVRGARRLVLPGRTPAVPVAFGAGVKRKVLAPLLAGLPVVTTTAGAHGLRDHPALVRCDQPSAFAGALVRRLEAAAVLAPVSPADLLDADDSAAVLAWLRG